MNTFPNGSVLTSAAFRAVMSTSQPETPLPLDLDIKLRILTVTYQLWNYTLRPATAPTPDDHNLRLASIGIEFMDMCAVAVSKVSETRWFDTGAQFMTQAVLAEQRDGTARPEALDRFYAWKPSGLEQNLKWSSVLEHFAAELPDSVGLHAAWETLQQRYPFAEFKATVLAFLFELMTTLDQPVLIQLEQGKLGSLTTAETQQLKERAGIR